MAQEKEEKKISVNIVTPEEKIFEGKVDFIRVPAQSGNLGVLPRHVPIIAQLKIGVVKLVNNGESDYIGVCRGFFEFLNNRATILTELALPTKQEDISRTIEELRQKHDITQEITEETRKVVQAIAGLKSLRQ